MTQSCANFCILRNCCNSRQTLLSFLKSNLNPACQHYPTRHLESRLSLLRASRVKRVACAATLKNKTRHLLTCFDFWLSDLQNFLHTVVCNKKSISLKFCNCIFYDAVAWNRNKDPRKQSALVSALIEVTSQSLLFTIVRHLRECVFNLVQIGRFRQTHNKEKTCMPRG